MSDVEGFRIALKANNNMFISRIDRGSAMPIEACKSSIDPYSQFTLIFLGEDNVALRADNGLYLGRIDRGSSNTIDAIKQQIDPFAIFKLESLGGDVIALRADNGPYIGRVNRGSMNPIEVQSGFMDVQNKFFVVSLDN